MRVLVLLIFILGFSFGDIFEWEVEVGEDVKGKLIRSLEEKGVEAVKVFELSPTYTYLFICGGAPGVLQDLPQLLTFYICRVYIYRDTRGNSKVGYVNAGNLMKVFGKHLSEEERRSLKEFTERVVSAIEEVRKK